MGMISGRDQDNDWPIDNLDSVEKTIEILDELSGKRWICRGQAKNYDGKLLAPIDRPIYSHLNRVQKISLERESLAVFRSTIRYFSPGEEGTLYNNIPTLMLMQHNNVPTRLVDWSQSPFIAMNFAVCEYDNKDDWQDGELWSFDYDRYLEKASEQWERFPETKKDGKDGKEFDNELPTIFSSEEPENAWFVLQVLRGEFSRLTAQKGLFSVTSRFGIDHSIALQELLEKKVFYHKYIVDKEIKQEIAQILKDKYGIWEGSIYPDSSGVAKAIKKSVYKI